MYVYVASYPAITGINMMIYGDLWWYHIYDIPSGKLT